jgi:hypothetical protein
MHLTLPPLGLHGLGGLWSTIADRAALSLARRMPFLHWEAHMKTTWRVERLKDLAALSVGLSVLLLIARLW